MGKASDATYLQMKMLNTGKGVGVQTLRAQIDKIEYMKYMQQKIKEEPNITVIETMAVSLIIEDGVCKGIKCSNNEDYYAKATILTTGTYLESMFLLVINFIRPEDQPSVKGLSASLRSYGIPTLRLKTELLHEFIVTQLIFQRWKFNMVHQVN